jgi:hypothetical protein
MEQVLFRAGPLVEGQLDSYYCLECMKETGQGWRAEELSVVMDLLKQLTKKKRENNERTRGE